MILEILNVISTDKLELPGLLFSPKIKSEKVAIYLHGNGDSGVFYQNKMLNALGSELTKKGVSFLAFNNRGARYKKKLIVSDSGEPGKEDKVIGGAHYELIEDCSKDIDGAINYLSSNGYKEFYLIGFSTGANKICVYDKLSKNNKVSKYIHAGPGDDSGLFYNEIGKDKFNLAIEYAENAISTNNPLKIMPKYTGMNPFSAQSALDILNPNGSYNTFPYYESTVNRLGHKKLFDEYSAITKPMLVVFGEFDEFTYTGGGTSKTLDILYSVTNKRIIKDSDFKIIDNTDHGFHGKELDLANLISNWITK